MLSESAKCKDRIHIYLTIHLSFTMGPFNDKQSAQHEMCSLQEKRAGR